jgi:hypothetical protein
LSVVIFIRNAFVMEFIQSQKKKKKILKYNGYLYRFVKKYKSTLYWKCNEILCKSSFNLKNEEIVKLHSILILKFYYYLLYYKGISTNENNFLFFVINVFAVKIFRDFYFRDLNSRLQMLKTLIVNNKHSKLNIKLLLYKSLLKPIWTYGLHL